MIQNQDEIDAILGPNLLEYRNTIQAHRHPYYLALAFKDLYEANLLTPTLRTMTAQHLYPRIFTTLLKKLQQTGLMSEEMLALANMHTIVSELFDALILLHQHHLLTPSNQEIAIKKQFSALTWANALVEVHQAGISNPVFLSLLEQHANPLNLSWILGLLQHHRILDQVPMKQVLSFSNSPYFIEKLKTLAHDNLLNFEHLSIIVHNDEATWLITKLHHAGLLTPENIAVITKHPKQHDVALAWIKLEKAGLLTLKYRDLVLADPNPYSIAQTIIYLHECDTLTPERRTQVLNHPLSRDVAFSFWTLHLYTLLSLENQEALLTHLRLKDIAQKLGFFNRYVHIDQALFDILMTHPSPHELFWPLRYLKEARLLTPKHQELVIAYPDLKNLAELLKILSNKRLLNESIFLAIMNHQNPTSLVKGLEKLHEVNYSSPELQAKLVEHPKPEDLANGFIELRQISQLTPGYQQLLSTHPHPSDLASAISRLYYHELFIPLSCGLLLTPQNITMLHLHLKPLLIAQVIIDLYEIDQLSPVHLVRITATPEPTLMTSILKILHTANLLTPEHLEYAINHPNPLRFSIVLRRLARMDFLSDEVFFDLMNPNHQALYTLEIQQLLWDAPFPDEVFIDNWTHILRAVSEEDAEGALEELLHAIEFELEQEQFHEHEEEDFNPQQSTHTASVHRSISASATNLMNAYGGHDLEEKSMELTNLVSHLTDTSLSTQAAQRAIHRLIESEDYRDPVSQISIQELLGLVYIAICDESRRLCSYEEMLAMLVHGLYEIQRGYNLNDKGVDDNDIEDQFICSAGTFNKILEKLNGVHTLVQIEYITKEMAALKFPKQVQYHVIKHLSAFTSPQTPQAFHAIRAEFLALIEEGTIEPIWAQIQKLVAHELWQEFKEAYGHDKKHVDFINLLENAIYCELPDLTPIIQTLHNAPGSLTSNMNSALTECRTFGAFSRHSFWEQRHNSAKAQREYNMQFGLSLMGS